MEIAESHLKSKDHFIVDVIVTASNGPKKLLVLLDADGGLNIDDCADLSRSIGNELEERNLIENAYRLEVSSPGVDYPLHLLRQYKKNIGRVVKVSLQEGIDIQGELLEVNETRLLLKKEVLKGKNKKYEEVEIPFSTIKQTIVQISFK